MTNIQNKKGISIHWFRKGLRLHDNPALLEAIQKGEQFVPIFILDPWFVKPDKVVGLIRLGLYEPDAVSARLSERPLLAAATELQLATAGAQRQPHPSAPPISVTTARRNNTHL